MICGCCKDLGCYAYNDVIKFGFKMPTDGSVTFHIWSNGTYTTVFQAYFTDEEVSLAYTFNENSETTIKIQYNPGFSIDPAYGNSFFTTADGACCFTVHGQLSTCN